MILVYTNPTTRPWNPGWYNLTGVTLAKGWFKVYGDLDWPKNNGLPYAEVLFGKLGQACAVMRSGRTCGTCELRG